MTDQHEQELLKGEITDLLNVDNGLSDWTVGFIDSINQRQESGLGLTVKQAAKVHELWDRHCA